MGVYGFLFPELGLVGAGPAEECSAGATWRIFALNHYHPLTHPGEPSNSADCKMVLLSQLFAEDIPLPRGNSATWASIIVMFASLTCMLCSTEVNIVQQIIFQLFVSLLAGSMIKLCEFLEECRHIPSRYKNAWEALNASFNLKRHGCGIILLILFYIVHDSKIGGIGFSSSLAKQLNVCCFCYAFLKVFGFLDLTPAEISEICEKNKFNVAHGLAWSYYIGYLKLILPNLEERMKEYQCSVKYVPDCKENWKLYILIPFNCKIYDKLEKVDSRIQFFGNLPELCIDRAGIKGRSYKNSIYAVKDQWERPHHCILEYATPLRSLLEMSNDATAAFSKEQRLEQAKLFYITLENILNNSQECAGYFKLIPYGDDLEEGNVGSEFLSTKILQHLAQERMEYTVPEQSTWDATLSEDQLMISGSEDPQTLQSINH